MFVSCFMIILSELPFFEAHSLGGPKLLMPCWGQATSYMHFVMQWMHMNPKVQLILFLKSLNYPNTTRKEHTSLCFRIPFMWWWKGIHEVCSRGMFGWNLQHVKCTSLKIQRLLLPSRSQHISLVCDFFVSLQKTCYRILRVFEGVVVFASLEVEHHPRIPWLMCFLAGHVLKKTRFFGTFLNF